MMFRCWEIIAAVFLLSSGVPIDGSRLTFDSGAKTRLLGESELIMRSLGGALKFLAERRENVTGDVVLGVFLTSANLQWIYHRLTYKLSGRPWPDRQLEQLLGQCRQIIETAKPGSLALLNESLWENAASDLKYGHLKRHDRHFFPPEFDSCQSVDAYMMRGTPEDSDFCIHELLTSGCRASEYCWFSESNGLSHSGYKTTHRLLYFQVAFKMKCDQVNPRKFSGTRKMKEELCQQMFLEAAALFQKSSISATRDLFMEQIALCGLEGYQEFAADPWRAQVRTWQNYNGCFGVDESFRHCSPDEFRRSNATVLTKRTDSTVNDCHTHVTAVAISALAFFLRVTLNAALSLP